MRRRRISVATNESTIVTTDRVKKTIETQLRDVVTMHLECGNQKGVGRMKSERCNVIPTVND